METPDHLDDDILSALLDGDRGAMGDDGPRADAAAHLRSCGRCAGRRAELAAARAALAAAPVEPLDEVTRRRLVAGALQAGDASTGPTTFAGRTRSGRSGWAARRPALIGSAAAVLLGLLVGVPFVVGDNGGSGGDATLSADAPPAALESASPFLGDLGDLSEHDRLRLRLADAGPAGFAYSAPREPGASPAGGAPSPAPAPAAAPTAGGLAGSPSARTADPASATADDAGGEEKATADQPVQGTRNSGADAFAADRDRAAADACVAALLNGPARGGRLVASGTGTFDGRPAIVAAFELSGGTVAFVTDRSGCAVLDRFSV